MLIRREFRRLVGFVTADKRLDNGTVVPTPRGTTFFVEVPAEDAAGRFGVELFTWYAVTARHVVDGARAAGSMYVRLNRQDGGFDDVPVDPDDWTCSTSTDLAVIPFPAPDDAYEVSAFPLKWFMTADKVAAREVGPGDDLFFVSLFTQHPGRARAEPIVRFGNVSLMPGEAIRLKASDGTATAVHGYLAEARSWGGNSGSPCFVYFPSDRHDGHYRMLTISSAENADKEIEEHNVPAWLLGVVVGHFDVREDAAFDLHGAQGLMMNSGVAVVVPAEDLINLLEQPDLVEERLVALDKYEESEPVATMDSATESEFDSFEGLTRRLLNVSKSEVDEQRKQP